MVERDASVTSPDMPAKAPAGGGELALPDGSSRQAVQFARGEKLAVVVARYVANYVVAQRLAPGSPLATEQEMAQQFGVGRPSVREALRLLEAQGLIVIRPGQGGGPVVAEHSPLALGPTLSLHLQMRGVTFRDALEANVRLQGIHAAMAAERVKAGDSSLLDELRKASRVDSVGAESDQLFIEAGSRFHGVISQMADSPTLDVLMGGLAHLYKMLVSQAHTHWEPREREEDAMDHRRIEAAIRAGQPEKARRLNEEHLRNEILLIDKKSSDILEAVVTWS